MLLGWVNRYGFRMRRQFQSVLEGRMNNMDDLRTKFGALEKLMVTPEDHILFRKNLMKYKNRYKKLAALEPTQTSLEDTSTNEMLFRLFNDAVADRMETIINEKDMQTILSLTRQLSSQSLLHDKLLRDYSRTKPLTDEVRRRFSYLEQFVCHLCFKGYTKLVKSSPFVNPFELNSEKKDRTKFKEDFQFELEEDLSLEHVEEVAGVVEVFSRFGVGGEKVYLLAELLLTKYIGKISPNAIGRLAFCLGHAKRAVRSVEEPLCDILQNSDNTIAPTNMVKIMYYLLVNRIHPYLTWEKMIGEFLNQKSLDQLNPSEARLARSLIMTLKSTENLNHLPLLQKEKWAELLSSNIQKEPEPTQPSLEQQKFRRFLTRHRYFYSESPEPYLLGRAYLTQSLPPQHLIFLDMHRFTLHKKQTGLVFLLKDYYHFNQISLKVVAAHQTIDSQTRREDDSYFHSKLKGCKRDQTPKPIYFSY